MIRDVFESAQGSATETWDNLEALFQSRVQRALQQIGVPNASEIRLLTKRVAELNDNVKALSAKSARSAKAKRVPAKAKRKA
jgi:polyhydroxyalkanoate synthesis regulator phasin